MNKDQQIRLQSRQAIELVSKNIELQEKVEKMEAREAQLLEQLMEERSKNGELLKEIESTRGYQKVQQPPTTISSILSIQQVHEQKQMLAQQLLDMERRALEAQQGLSSMRILISELKCQLAQKNAEKKQADPKTSVQYLQLQQNYRMLQQEYEGIITNLMEEMRGNEVTILMKKPTEMSRLGQSQFHPLQMKQSKFSPARNKYN